MRGHAEPHTAGPARLPHIIGDHAEVQGEGTGCESADLGSNSSSILFAVHPSLVSLTLTFLVCKMGKILPDLWGSVRAK